MSDRAQLTVIIPPFDNYVTPTNPGARSFLEVLQYAAEQSDRPNPDVPWPDIGNIYEFFWKHATPQQWRTDDDLNTHDTHRVFFDGLYRAILLMHRVGLRVTPASAQMYDLDLLAFWLNVDEKIWGNLSDTKKRLYLAYARLLEQVRGADQLLPLLRTIFGVEAQMIWDISLPFRRVVQAAGGDGDLTELRLLIRRLMPAYVEVQLTYSDGYPSQADTNLWTDLTPTFIGVYDESVF